MNHHQPADIRSPLSDVEGVAALLHCSVKTVRRLVDAGKIPGVVRIGRLMRFDLTVISGWIDKGCPPCRPAPGL